MWAENMRYGVQDDPHRDCLGSQVFPRGLSIEPKHRVSVFFSILVLVAGLLFAAYCLLLASKRASLSQGSQYFDETPKVLSSSAW